jgi:FolB domain-containing protein
MEQIILKEISVTAHLGVTDKEKVKKQKILITVSIVPDFQFNSLNDSIDNTVNYSDIRGDIINIISTNRFNLIETAAGKIASHIKNNYPVKNLAVVIKKFPYKDTKYVAFELKI